MTQPKELMFLVEYEHMMDKHKILIPAISRDEAEAKLVSLSVTGRVAGKVMGEIKGDSRLLTKIFGEEL